MLIDVGTNRRIEVSWQAGPHDWVTLNSDGSVLGVRGSSAAGGLITDSSGNCLHAFTINMGVCSITRAEIRGAIEGVREGNHSADFLANLGHSLSLGTHQVPI
ncbi:Putative ribonuclease H protein At1g65750 [Linum perenne]